MDDIAQAYTVLELKPGASLSDVNQAYKDLVFIWHPDRIPADNTRLRDKAQDKLKRLNDARSRLKQYLRSGKTASKTGSRTSNYNPERYGSSRYRSYSENRYTRSYGTANSPGNTNGASTATQNGNRATSPYRSSSNGRYGSQTSSSTNGSASSNGSTNGSAS
ncbi:MAG: J domain-containing protein, partial [Cyanobacteria bacterium J06636_28]